MIKSFLYCLLQLLNFFVNILKIKISPDDELDEDELLEQIQRKAAYAEKIRERKSNRAKRLITSYSPGSAIHQYREKGFAEKIVSWRIVRNLYILP